MHGFDELACCVVGELRFGRLGGMVCDKEEMPEKSLELGWVRVIQRKKENFIMDHT